MEPNRLLALAAASGRIGIVFFVGPRLIDWRISNFAARSPRSAAAFADKLIVFLKPDVVITESAPSAAHKGDKTKLLILAMGEAAANHEVLDIAVKREFRFPNKYAEAEALVQLYPDLIPWKPKPRRFFDNEPRNTVLFEALVLADQLIAKDA
jgi:hypothetical protein